MKSLYIAMQGGCHPIALVIPSPRAVFSSRKEANEYIKVRANPNLWYVRKVLNMTKEKNQKAALRAQPVSDDAMDALVEALEVLAKLGNGEHYGNSDGNVIAQMALAAYRAAQEKPHD